ncbi:hypothetical protein V9T40_013279 [Parthenolecanium corni]|uniref:L-dopachrome isomerase n=1 Tax=Parthenolecanium corni TaxID=536013 RepID=A0AAN9Y5Y1_9HEMI
MPIFTLTTNLPPSKVTPNVMAKASEFVADLFGEKEKAILKEFDIHKDASSNEQNVLVSMKAGVSMCWGPTPGTFALGTIQNTDPMQAEDTKHLAPAIFEFCEKELSIPQNR